ncbi:MAG: hypothetical protein HWQ38_38050 [Nostoc sp. NMS7]|uniref:hypothetical protein n=1 Tax=Nostoc sp. NMS7 TaxID=2815391 RepID=UPI0025EF17A7|nr:hypothetical protein [Nostoc sp. NMS7]MBN3951962.1 hypothetical protein [Nostoc sp. NMS7]
MHRLASFITADSNSKILNCTAKRFYVTAVLLTVFSTLVAGCSTEGKQAILPSPTPHTATNPVPTLEQTTLQASAKAQPSPQADPYPDATSIAIGAATISQSAQSSDDWKLVAQMWLQAIALMQSVPSTSSNYASAQKKVAEYQKNLRLANKQSIKPVTSVVATAQPVIQQASFSSVISISRPSAPTIAAKPRPLTTIAPVQSQAIASKPKQLTFKDKEHTLEASAKVFMNEYFDQTINKGMRGEVYSCAKTPELSSSLYSPQSATILETWVALDGSTATVTARIESSTGDGTPIRQNWQFALVKGDTLAEKQMLSDSTDAYKYSKTKYGGWCVKLLTEA